VRDVRQALVEDRNLAYTTVMTVLDRLEKRGGVSRRKQGRHFLYAPKVSRETLRKLAVQDLAEDFFDGSLEDLRQYLARAAEPSAPEVLNAGDNMEAALL
jgi:BlaI family transcriptional regulator, penicillinase repressor